MSRRAGNAEAEPRIAVQVATARKGVPHANTLRSWAEAALQLPAPQPAVSSVRTVSALTLRIVGAAEGRRLNRQWRGKDKPTNVLSFPAGDAPGPEQPAPLGDIVICAPVVRREAREQGKSTQAHWAHMIVHGVLHLSGYDHERVRDAELMERVETWLLASLGFPDPYSHVAFLRTAER